MSKIILLVVAVIILTVNAEYKVKNEEDFLKFREECVTEMKVPADHVNKYKKWDYPDDEVTRCYIQCVFIKMELFDAEEGYKVSNLVKQLKQNPKTEDDIQSRVDNCIDENKQKSDSCTWLFRGFKCFMSKNLQLVQQSIKQ